LNLPWDVYRRWLCQGLKVNLKDASMQAVAMSEKGADFCLLNPLHECQEHESKPPSALHYSSDFGMLQILDDKKLNVANCINYLSNTLERVLPLVDFAGR